MCAYEERTNLSHREFHSNMPGFRGHSGKYNKTRVLDGNHMEPCTSIISRTI